MEYRTSLKSTLFVIFIHISVLNCTHLSKTYFNDVSTNNGEIVPRISWVFSNSVDSSVRVKRASIDNLPEDSLLRSMNIKCRKNLYSLCNHIGGNSDELMLLECIQNLKV